MNQYSGAPGMQPPGGQGAPMPGGPTPGGQGFTPPGYAGPTPPQYGAPPQYRTPPPKGSKTGVIIAVSIACVLIIAAGILIAFTDFFGGRGTTGSGIGISTPPVANQGFATYEALIEAYFDAFESGDERKIAGYFLPEILDLVEEWGYAKTDVEALENLDAMYKFYGAEVTWDESGTEVLDISGTYLEDTDIDTSKIESIKSVSIELEVTGRESDGWYYFEVVKIGGKWYLMEIW